MRYKKQILFSYILVSCAVILFSNFLIFFSINDREIELRQDFNEAHVMQLRSTLDYILNKISQDLIYLSFQEEFLNLKEWYNTSSYREKNEFIRDFNPFKTLTDYFSEALIVHPNDDMVLDLKNKLVSTIGSSRVRSEIDTLLKLSSNLYGEQIYSLTFKNSNTITSIYLVKPLYNHISENKAFIFLKLSNFLFKEIMDEIFLSESSFAVISDAEGNILKIRSVNYNTEELDIVEILETTLESDGSVQIKLAEDTLFVSHAESDEFNWNVYYASTIC